jgi:hypothetical protein
MIKPRKRTIFEQASWNDLTYRKHQPNKYEKKLKDIPPLDPPQEEPSLEVETSLPPSEPNTQPIKVELQPPKGYILFPEPPPNSGDLEIKEDDTSIE